MTVFPPYLKDCGPLHTLVVEVPLSPRCLVAPLTELSQHRPVLCGAVQVGQEEGVGTVPDVLLHVDQAACVEGWRQASQ